MTDLILLAQNFITSLIGNECYTELIENLNVTNVKCIKLAMSKVIGLGMVCGGAILKVPQIIKIIMAKSTKGISVVAYFLETVALLISIAYNVRNGYAFTTWGEYPFMVIQCYAVLFLIYFFRKTKKNLGYLLASVVAFMVIFNKGLISSTLLQVLQTSTIGITIASRLPQIFSNIKNGNTGELSVITVFFQFAGSLARVFTTIQEVDDYLVMSGNIIATSLNTVLFFQMIYYWKSGYKPINNRKTKNI